MTKSARRRAREYALQGLYQWQVGRNAAADIESNIAEDEKFAQADSDYFKRLLAGTVEHATMLEQSLSPALDRKPEELSPIERCILLLAAYELVHVREIPFRVVINEAIELAKTFGGTDGYKYVNGVLDKIVPLLRPDEKAAMQGSAHRPE